MLSNVLQQKEITIDEEYYVLQQIPAFTGLKIQHKLMELSEQGISWNPEVVLEVISASVIKNGQLVDNKKFDVMFAGKTTHLSNVFNAAVEFNFFEEDKDGESVPLA